MGNEKLTENPDEVALFPAFATSFVLAVRAIFLSVTNFGGGQTLSRLFAGEGNCKKMKVKEGGFQRKVGPVSDFALSLFDLLSVFGGLAISYL